MASKHRWVCPVCGVGVLAGKAPRTNATVRYCLDCSAKSETLVERTCPVLETKRQAAAQRRQDRTIRQHQQREAKAAAAKRAKLEREAERHRKLLDTRWTTDAPEHVRQEMLTLDAKFPADVTRINGVVYLRLSKTKWKYEQMSSTPHSRTELAVLLDYAHSIGHPDAESMSEAFLQLGGLPDAEVETEARA